MRERSDSAPAVSILMAAYNAMPYITEALDDLLNQDFPDFELVVVEDGSTDDTPDVLTTYSARDARIRVLRNAANVGLTRSLNKGLDACSADLVARADADDRYDPARVRKQVAFMRAHPDVGLLSCAVHKMHADGSRFLTRHFPTQDIHIRLRELFVNSFSHPGAMFRTALVRSVGGYDVAYWTGEDGDLWSRLLPLTRVANLEEPLVHYRKHQRSVVQRHTRELADLGLTVRQRNLSRFLGRSVAIDEARAMVDLFRARGIPAENDFERARIGMSEVFARADATYGTRRTRPLRAEAAQSALELAAASTEANPALGRALALQAVDWHPTVLVDRTRSRQLLRCLAPPLIREQVRRARTWLPPSDKGS